MALYVTLFPDTLTMNPFQFGYHIEERSISGYNLTDSVTITSKLRELDGEVIH